MKRIVLNDKNLVQDDSWLNFRKVRAIIEDDFGNILISSEGGKLIFPGGKCDENESDEDAIIREVREETGIELDELLEKVLVISSYYKDFYDYRTKGPKPRHTETTYFYVKTNKEIDVNNMSLTKAEIDQNLKLFKLSKPDLFKYLNLDHSAAENGKFFDEENKVVLEEIFMQKKH